MIVILLIMLLISYTVHYIALEEERIFQAESTIAYYEKELQWRLHERSLRMYAYYLGKKYLENILSVSSESPTEYLITELALPEHLQGIYRDGRLDIRRLNRKTNHFDDYCTMKYEDGRYAIIYN